MTESNSIYSELWLRPPNVASHVDEPPGINYKCVSDDGSVYGTANPRYSSNMRYRKLANNELLERVEPTVSNSNDHPFLYRINQEGELDWTIELNMTAKLVDLRSSFGESNTLPRSKTSIYPIFCSIDADGNLWLVSERLNFGDSENWSDDFHNDFHVAKITPDGVIQHEVFGESNHDHSARPLDIWYDSANNEFVILGIYCIKTKNDQYDQSCETGIPGIADPPTVVNEPSNPNYGNYSNFTTYGAPFVFSIDSSLRVTNSKAFDLRCSDRDEGSSWSTTIDRCGRWDMKILGRNSSGDYWFISHQDASTSHEHYSDPLEGLGCTTHQDALFSLKSDWSDWSASICSGSSGSTSIYGDLWDSFQDRDKTYLDFTIVDDVDELKIISVADNPGHVATVAINLSGLNGKISGTTDVGIFVQSARTCSLVEFSSHSSISGSQHVKANQDGYTIVANTLSSIYQDYYSWENNPCIGGGSTIRNYSIPHEYFQDDAIVILQGSWENGSGYSISAIDSSIDDRLDTSPGSVSFSNERNSIFISAQLCYDSGNTGSYCQFYYRDRLMYSDSLSNSAYGTFLFSIDKDGDSWPDLSDDLPFESTQHSDQDGDGYGDDMFGNTPDSCPAVAGNSTVDLFGCLDFDGDGWSNQGDALPADRTQYSDIDGDGFGDNSSGQRFDSCVTEYGSSFLGEMFGCPDDDGDGYANTIDEFVNDSSQWTDSDGDGYGDNPIGYRGDSCPSESGMSSVDRFGCPDADGDGHSDFGDDLPFDAQHYFDIDGDGFGDNASADVYDLFPSDPSQWNDTDGDGYGDNLFGNGGDFCPDEYGESIVDVYGCIDTDGDGYSDLNDGFIFDKMRWLDSDGDGVDDSQDVFPFDPTQTNDSDGDKMGDNPYGIGADKFPLDSTQWSDVDGDGYGDNQSGNNPDAFITDPTQWSDRDGDGYGDNPSGRMYDQFPDDPTQWLDEDGDGLGDNQSGNNPDPYLTDFDNDGFNDSIDILPKLSSPGDLDADGCLDENDVFPTDPKECLDFDEDGVGDNSDPDDDDDGVLDTVEIQEGTDPMNSAEKPIESFEVILPGTAVGLGAWDLIGIFGGVPIGLWIIVGLLTRKGRYQRLEERLFGAMDEEELSIVSNAYEKALMWRMIGPHQALRLERIRSNLEVKFNELEKKILDGEEITTGKNYFSETLATPPHEMDGTVHSDGYEWLEFEGSQWYRPAESNSDWTRWQ